MGGSIGVVGGGQLAWMLAAAAREQGVELHVQTPELSDPAARLATSVVRAALDDLAATRSLAQRTSAISFENEWLDLDSLAPLEQEGVVFIPRLDSLADLVCKRRQRQLLERLRLPSPRWFPLEQMLTPPAPAPAEQGDPALAGVRDGAGEAAEPALPQPPRLPAGFDFPLMAKAVRGGYDGRGTRVIRSQAELEALIEAVDPSLWLLEEFVAFEQELALVACRDHFGAVQCYPLVETHQHDQVCDWVLAPAAASQAVEARARNVAASLLAALNYVGVLSIEFFYGPSGLLINELAPRTHNSGHYTIEACLTSQFAQQVRIVSGEPLGDTSMTMRGALMVNLLGFETSTAAYARQRQALEALADVHLHWYGKRLARPGRKLGHLTVELKASGAAERVREASLRLAEVRAIWPLPPARTP
ncbi:5-(carboxyamino)imidazole ribonucleotide synthase [Synechococcus sp. Cruz-9H2]|uniref:5-(carboxyamino)imidazole ribonucleotide synthase n=1 Tax=unclassified Synechococcus TaxID=2626047 RepID=UPI0020CD3631|nr:MULTISPECIES: 5-(carboxyamino)imidazole ribonucleotide synthase [unclassified Synechococcus]MCP9817981.1 5-(carboxyamino)imidazole ribonucleotide synthase [Synechococcus sp. Cruz-9H2]MCP9842519.1 5-(carboxyamino)imidazole ribonucleotide synthase [Synechococcus sp. Edmonson 11F2]MCP9854377.1 5-(carboxyamino)imidazole ribonucleotide synthase [Synechococcus sp. Cruz-9C9]MCP9861927.1 5-(carboxyamino)imidazole ribonucleotide synthase [Synechococcus sp. Cruz-7E5]MCP9868889.1 5-(carboxyamino)imida